MSSVPAGSRLVLRTARASVHLRALETVELGEAWALPVLAPITALDDGVGVLELATQDGVLTVPAHLVAGDGRLEVRPGHPGPQASPVLHQRREDARGQVELPVRGTAVDALGEAALDTAQVAGSTISISAGGLSARLPYGVRAPSGARLYLELELPDGVLVPSVVSVVELGLGQLRGRFVDIAPVDRERLVRLVFAEQRRRAAARRLLRDGG